RNPGRGHRRCVGRPAGALHCRSGGASTGGIDTGPYDQGRPRPGAQARHEPGGVLAAAAASPEHIGPGSRCPQDRMGVVHLVARWWLILRIRVPATHPTGAVFMKRCLGSPPIGNLALWACIISAIAAIAPGPALAAFSPA